MRMFFILAAAVLTGCTAEPPSAANDQSAAGGPASNDVVSMPVEPGPASTPPDMSDDPDQCGADSYQWLVGENRSRIPEQPAGATWRVTCTTCPVTQDYSPQRMNIFFDQETEIVQSVSCG